MTQPLTTTHIPASTNASAVMDARSNGTERHCAEKEIYQYDAPWPVYALNWCTAQTDREGFRLAVGSLIEEQINKVQMFKFGICLLQALILLAKAYGFVIFC
ncbi:hypothetical protein BDC45DRAFT_607243 [Circinella umbellata]|nr:hypothetical protein BDC45DRAFT_607243 [Circinella umbellata]